jgi:hypothetical protein
MNRSLFCLFALALLSACSTPVAPAGMAYIRPMVMRSTIAKTFTPQLVIREMDHREIDPVTGAQGMAITPGPHTLLLTMMSQTGSTIGDLSLGRTGRALGAAIDELHSARFEQVLSFVAIAGHTYRAAVMEGGHGYRYWIEDETTRRVVAGSRDW